MLFRSIFFTTKSYIGLRVTSGGTEWIKCMHAMSPNPSNQLPFWRERCLGVFQLTELTLGWNLEEVRLFPEKADIQTFQEYTPGFQPISTWLKT